MALLGIPTLLMNPWVILGFVASLAVSGATGWHLGAKNNEAGWQTREAKINAETAVKIAESKDKVIATERKSALELVAVSKDYQNKLKDKENEKQTIIASVRDGTRKLSIGARCPSSGILTTPVAPAPGGRDGEARAELSNEASEFLVSEASRADQIVAQLSACQAVIEQDRK